MTNGSGAVVNRFIQHTAIQTAKNYNAAYAAARTNALVELASNIKTQLVTKAKQELANSQNSSSEAESLDQFTQKTDLIVDQTLTNSIPLIAIFRRLPNGNFEVQVRLAFDKKEIQYRMRQGIQRELKEKGKVLDTAVDKVVSNL